MSERWKYSPEMTEPPDGPPDNNPPGEEPIPDEEYEWPGIEPHRDEVPWEEVSPEDPPVVPDKPNPN